MKVIETKLKGCFIIEPRVFKDDRGTFFESYNNRRFCEAIGRKVNFIQDNQSFSKKGVIRALHYQIGEFAQSKLVRVLQGKVLDVAVDLREGSSTFGDHVAVELSEENRRQLFIPRGFAHGFAVLSDSAEFFYKCDNYYNAASEGGVYYADPELGIDWRLPTAQVRLSDKDAGLPLLKSARL